MNPRKTRYINSIFFGLAAVALLQACDKTDNSATAKLPDAASPVAEVYGEAIHTTNADEIQAIILTHLFDRYAKEQNIAVSDEEVNTFVDEMRKGMRAKGLTAEDGLTPEELAQVQQMRRDMGHSIIRQWKLNRALYQQYGGRIIAQQLGPEPLDAYRHYLQERESAGDFSIYREDIKEAFWKYFTDESIHQFYESGSEAETQAFEVPPWKKTH